MLLGSPNPPGNNRSFGSQARGDAWDSSDTDLLLCLTRAAELNRTIYSRWDELVDRSGGKFTESISPHFAVLPESAEVAGSLWFEVATDGIVLWDRQLAVSKFLVAVRRYLCLKDVSLVRRAVLGEADAESSG